MYIFAVEDKSFAVLTGDGDELLGKSLAETGTWEPWQLELYRRLLSPKSVCYDIGANIGTNCLAMEHYAPEGQIIAFEPVPGTFELLTKNLAANGSAIKAVNLGLSDRRAQALIVVTPSMLANAHEVAEGCVIPEGSDTVSMSVLPLDGWRTENGAPAPDLIKVDVEGFELEVLNGGLASFSGVDTVTIIEFAVTAQRTAGLTQFPETPKDVQLFRALQDVFEHILLISRNGRLCRVTSYAHLRIAMMNGTPTEDLLCCHRIPESVADMVDDLAFPASLTSELTVGPTGTVIALNHDVDGWVRALPELGAVSALVVNSSTQVDLRLNFTPLYQQHTDVPLRHVMVSWGDHVAFSDSNLTVTVEPGVNWILLESQNAFPASSYLGNPADPRRIGFKFTIA